MDTKFTPGKWTARKQPDNPGAWYVASVGSDEQGRKMTSFPALCEIHKGPNEANARLIAAAPDMYEALNWAKKLIEAIVIQRDIIADPEEITSGPIMKTIDAALAKVQP